MRKGTIHYSANDNSARDRHITNGVNIVLGFYTLLRNSFYY